MHIQFAKNQLHSFMSRIGSGSLRPTNTATRAHFISSKTAPGCSSTSLRVSWLKTSLPTSSWHGCKSLDERDYVTSRLRVHLVDPSRYFLTKRQQMGGFISKAFAKDDADDAVSLEPPYLIVGLGNPGAKYKNHRHNVGFMAIEEIGAAHDITFSRLQKNCHVGRGYIHNQKVVLAKPMTFMNNSGEGVSKLLKQYGTPLEKLIVLTDDLDTAPGKVRLKQKGGHGGQNGLRSIIDLVKSKDFARVKIGIGRPGPGDDVVSHVLSDFSSDEDAQSQLRAQLQETVDIVEAVISLGMEKALSGVRINTAEGPDTSKRKRQLGEEPVDAAKRQEVIVTTTL